MDHMSSQIHFILVQKLNLYRVYACALEELAIRGLVSYYILWVVKYFIWDIIILEILAKEVGKDGI